MSEWNIVYVLGKTAWLDAGEYITSFLDETKPVSANDGKTEELYVGPDPEREKISVDFHPIEGKLFNDRIILVPLPARADRAMNRIHQYTPDANVVFGIGYLGQDRRNLMPPGEICVPPIISLSDKLRREMQDKHIKLHADIIPDKELQEALYSEIGPVNNRSIRSVWDPSETSGNYEAFGQDMESGIMGHISNQYGRRFGFIGVSGDPQEGPVYEPEIRRYNRDHAAIEPLKKSSNAVLTVLANL